jgi:adenylate cyclase, class 2
MLEVEAKIALGPGEAEGLREALRRLGARAGPAEAQRDTYFAHPARDFRRTDEELRLRNRGRVRELTYKGPRDPGAQAKSRREETVEVGQDPTEVLEALGFRAVATVDKRREPWRLGEVEVALDEVEGLGEFVEVESTGRDAVEAGRLVEDVLKRLHLDGRPRIRDSYLELLQVKA